MAAVTAIINPLDPLETLLFYCSDDLQVGLSPRREDADEPGNPPKRGLKGGSEPAENTPAIGRPLTGDVSETPTGVIKNPSSFGAIRYKNLICVYGIRTDNKICLVSPAFYPLRAGPTTKANSLAACGNGENAGWVYYLDQDPLIIKETALAVGGSVVIQAEPSDDTYLCAYYKSPERFCIYQALKGLWITNVNSGSNGLIKNTSNAKRKTPMGVANNNGTIYLYYSDESNNLIRIAQRNGSWQSSAQVEGAPPMADGTQLTVSVTKDGEYNMIFYLPQGGEGTYFRYMDQANA